MVGKIERVNQDDADFINLITNEKKHIVRAVFTSSGYIMVRVLDVRYLNILISYLNHHGFCDLNENWLSEWNVVFLNGYTHIKIEWKQ